jgi:hypothetical protein
MGRAGQLANNRRSADLLVSRSTVHLTRRPQQARMEHPLKKSSHARATRNKPRGGGRFRDLADLTRDEFTSRGEDLLGTSCLMRISQAFLIRPLAYRMQENLRGVLAKSPRPFLQSQGEVELGAFL